MADTVMVGKSSINGLGVFTIRHVAPGDVILAIDDSYVIDDRQPVPAGEEHHCDYLEQGKVVWMQLPERHINHSCDPNVYVRTSSGVRQVLAIRQIEAGEEIACDYCINSSGNVVWTCNCGASRCRHSIHSDFFHLPLELQKEYLPFLDEWFAREHSAEIDELCAL